MTDIFHVSLTYRGQGALIYPWGPIRAPKSPLNNPNKKTIPLALMNSDWNHFVAALNSYPDPFWYFLWPHPHPGSQHCTSVTQTPIRVPNNQLPKGIMRSAVPLPCVFDVVNSQRVARQRPQQGTKSCRMEKNSVHPSIRPRGLRASWRGLRACQRVLRAS